MTNKGHVNNLHVAFFSMHKTSDGGGYIGAVLVTDDHGIPKEFKCTHPVRPTPVQEALYGANLEFYISTILCGKPLLEALKVPPSVCIVPTMDLLPLREAVELPIVYVARIGDSISSNAPSNRIENLSGRFDPIAVMTHDQFASDFDTIKNALTIVFKYVDLVEPFERMKTAIKVLGERDSRFR